MDSEVVVIAPVKHVVIITYNIMQWCQAVRLSQQLYVTHRTVRKMMTEIVDLLHVHWVNTKAVIE